MKKIKVFVFASGGGTNAEKLFNYFKDSDRVEMSRMVCNKEGAKVFDRAAKFGVESTLITNEQAADSAFLIDLCKEADFIVLAGYLRKIPAGFIQQFPERIVNIHPSLLPKYGGKNFYGEKVHLAVLENKEKETGITIHYVNENFDEGRIIAQLHTKLEEKDDLAAVQRKVQILEHAYFPFVVEQEVLKIEQ
ncbi:formyltetrahydrofolate-dependent phosphoribosylglycinamide formyltransferase [Lishizhenia tianjinensis]|uniref:phosphoribosylglycinamide formyltransferase 1 n=1 Tax=Lishizhenia tianjinensis TaxID=477690 RepID=A0A1I6ZN24_9FLAO|nr:phosphoribosylglycinamide formyltransferase [Lishizhenia tianjinensis]SFT64103.1 formyltetrahydrofolate-dependent phosphoribosylglycinamide formyltransferase [Lishizhenia tianjinensis]